jgi:RNAse (barnase) inhibitor barstar
LKAAERRLAEMAVLIKDVTTCKELRPLVQEYQRAADKKQFRRRYEGTLILYEAATKALKEQGFQKLPDLYSLKAEYKQLAEQKDQLQRQYAEAKRQMQEYDIIKQNVDGVLFPNHRQERNKTR